VFKYRVQAIPITEERVKLISEVITAMKLVKMYAWEKAFAQKVLGMLPYVKQLQNLCEFLKGSFNQVIVILII